MSTIYAQELQIKRLQEFFRTYEKEVRNMVADAIEVGILHKDDLTTLPH